MDQFEESPTVITSATKNLQKAVYDAAEAIYNGTFAGGESITLTAKEEGVNLPMENSRFENFTEMDYHEIYDKIAAGEIPIEKDTAADRADQLAVEWIRVEVIK